MKVGIELYVVFMFKGYKAFRCFAPYDTEHVFDLNSVLGINLFSTAYTIVDIANKRVLKHHRPPQLDLSDEFLHMIKSISLTEYTSVCEYAIQPHQEYISEFKGEYHFLSNFAPATFVWRNIFWNNSEAAYQAAKSDDPQTWLEFAKIFNPAEAKRRGKTVEMRTDWNDIKISIMYDIVFEKFNQSPDLKQRLLDTGNAVLEEGNVWKDTFWGVCPPGSSIGKNHLGKILMKVRQELRANIQF